MAWVQLILSYAAHVAPGVGLTLALAMALPRRSLELRLALFLLTFVVLRDAMTPFGLWRLGHVNGVLWMEFVESPEILVIVALGSLVLVGLFRALDPDLFALVVFFTKPFLKGRAEAVVVGVTGAVFLAGCVIFARTVMADDAYSYYGPRPTRPVSLNLATFTLSMAGNFLEEVLFRGMLQGHLEHQEGVSPLRAAILSGVAFAAFHVSLACAVTSLGMSLLFFVLLEGVVCGLVRMRSGVVASALTHGLVIFSIAGGFV